MSSGVNKVYPIYTTSKKLTVYAKGFVAKHGGKYLSRSTNYERLEGSDEDPAAFIIIECEGRIQI